MKSVSFGGLGAKPSNRVRPHWAAEVDLSRVGHFLPVGMGKSYGDVALVTEATEVISLALNRMLSFDTETGTLVCEPGVLLSEIQETFVKVGWMLPVTPGTSLITVGGAIANDVHGKDHHHAGTFGEHVQSLKLARSSGEVITCSAKANGEMFRATIGGLGLTGFIVQATLQLKPVKGPFVNSQIIPYESLGEFFRLSEETENENWQASVSWFDCSTSKAGRGSFTRGNPSERSGTLNSGSAALAVPFTPPISLVNKLSLDLFNTGYFWLQKRAAGESEMDYRQFYYPLDGVRNWNRIYGPKGFFQYQSVVPMAVAEQATSDMVSVIKKSGQGSFLAVLKTFGDRKPAGLLSFARHGVTLALDFPNRGERTEKLFTALDRIVFEAGGTLNPSKDARMSREMFEQGFPNAEAFAKYRDPACVSDFSRRLLD